MKLCFCVPSSRVALIHVFKQVKYILFCFCEEDYERMIIFNFSNYFYLLLYCA